VSLRLPSAASIRMRGHMAREFKKSFDALPQVGVPDWQLVERLAEVFSPYGEVRFEATDRRGTRTGADLETFRSEVEHEDEPLESIGVGVSCGFRGNPDFVWAKATASAVWRGVMFTAVAQDESIVNHVAARAEELIRAAGKRFEESRPAAPTPGRSEDSRLRRFLYDPWTVRIGGGIVLGALSVTAAWLLGWLF
jgi:hypothetical protein